MTIQGIHLRCMGMHRNVRQAVANDHEYSDRRRRKRKYRGEWMREHQNVKYCARDVYDCMVYVREREEAFMAHKEKNGI